MVDLIHNRDTWYGFPIQKVAFNVPFQCDTYSVLWMIIQRWLMGCEIRCILKTITMHCSLLQQSVPIVQPNDVRKVNLYKSIATNNVIPVSFRMRQCETFSLPQARSTVWRLGVGSAPEKPRWVLVGLQTNKSGNQENNGAVFDHCNLTNMQVRCKGDRGNVVLKDLKVLVERLVKWELLEGEIGARGEKGDKEDTGDIGQQGPIGPRVLHRSKTCTRC